MKKLLVLFLICFSISFSFEIISDKITGNIREVEFTYNNSEVKKIYGDNVEFASYYEYPLHITAELIKQFSVKNKNLEYLSILSKNGDKTMYHITIQRSKYLKGINIDKLNGIILYKHYKIFGNNKIIFGTNKNNRIQLDYLYDYKWK